MSVFRTVGIAAGAAAGIMLSQVGLGLSGGPASAANPAAPLAYVAAVNQLSVINTATNAIVATVPSMKTPGEVVVARTDRRSMSAITAPAR